MVDGWTPRSLKRREEFRWHGRREEEGRRRREGIEREGPFWVDWKEDESRSGYEMEGERKACPNKVSRRLARVSFVMVVVEEDAVRVEERSKGV